VVPAGKCPVAFRGDLEAWVGHLESHVYPNRYAVGVLRGWLRAQVGPDEYESLAPALADLLDTVPAGG
jgi:hypothetical protein